MKTLTQELEVPEFQNYEEEAEFWDNLDTADTMPDDDKWLHFDTPHQRALKVAILPGIAHELWEEARTRGVTIETLVNVFLSERVHELKSATLVTS